MEAFHKLFGTPKPIIAMAHLGPLPRTALYDRARGIEGNVEGVLAGVYALQRAGVDAIMFGNEGDRSYVTHATPETLAAMAAIVTEARRSVRVPFGVNDLWDLTASIALAHATGARFVREVFTGDCDSDMGVWARDAARAHRLRAEIGADCHAFFSINAEFASPMGTRSHAAKAQSPVFASLADAICVSGPMTGQSVGTSVVREVKEAVPNTPVIANTGVRLENVGDILSTADAAIVGTTETMGVVIDADGGIVGEASRAATLHSERPNWAEADPEQWWSNVVGIARDLLPGGRAEAVAAELARRGARTWCADLDVDAARSAADALGSDASWMRVDVTRRDGLEALRDRVLERDGRADVVVANAGISTMNRFLDLSYEEWDANLAVVGLVQAAANELGPLGVTINGVNPGFVRTSMQAREVAWEARLRSLSPEAVRTDYIGQTPLGRLQEPEDVARVVAFLASDDAGFVTGEFVEVNGGAATV